MGEATGIAWTTHTFNPVWGCTKVSAGCTNCYAETWAKRWGFDVWGNGKERRTFSDKHWNEPLQWEAAAAVSGQWALDIRDECELAGAAFFFKQHGGLRPTSGGHLLDGQVHQEFPDA